MLVVDRDRPEHLGTGGEVDEVEDVDGREELAGQVDVQSPPAPAGTMLPHRVGAGAQFARQRQQRARQLDDRPHPQRQLPLATCEADPALASP